MIMRKAKGLLIFIAFISIALALLFEPEKGVMGFLSNANVPVWLVAALFVLSGVTNLLLSWQKGHWNIAGFAILYSYTAMMWVGISYGYDISLAQAVSNTLLCSILTINAMEEVQWEK
ncbi:hypothetical protein LCGC14_0867060 [marine sediment metagenome]|uniref:Uncharacterized protein n=1 Tax=marine sediment metagenome TaxID=412755 RepID=A0A0F9RQC0_9ZZZZ